jgi:hypothetical protein
MVPWLIWHGPETFSSLQVASSLAMAGACAFLGLLLLLLWTPGYSDMSPHEKKDAKERIDFAYICFGFGLLSAAFGVYFLGPVAVLVIYLFIRMLLKSLRIVTNKT